MRDAILHEAQRLADLGLPVHWLVGPARGGKSPVRKHWQQQRCQSSGQLLQAYRRGFNLGVRTGWVAGSSVCLVALDVDGEAGFGFAAARGIPASPLRTVTRHGQHWLYRHPGAGVRCATRAKIDPARCVDVRGELGNLVIPPSVHETGFVYQAVEPWTRRLILSAPVWDPAWIPAPTVEPERHVPLPVGDDSLRRARRALARMSPAIQGQNGSLRCFVAAKTLIRRYGLAEQAALDLLLADYNPRCVPPWSESELRHKVRSALGSVDRAAS